MGANFHFRAAAVTCLAKYLLGPEVSRESPTTFPARSVVTRTEILMWPRIVLRALEEILGTSSCSTAGAVPAVTEPSAEPAASCGDLGEGARTAAAEGVVAAGEAESAGNAGAIAAGGEAVCEAVGGCCCALWGFAKIRSRAHTMANTTRIATICGT